MPRQSITTMLDLFQKDMWEARRVLLDDDEDDNSI
jgi:hypothetical protein